LNDRALGTLERYRYPLDIPPVACGWVEDDQGKVAVTLIVYRYPYAVNVPAG